MQRLRSLLWGRLESWTDSVQLAAGTAWWHAQHAMIEGLSCWAALHLLVWHWQLHQLVCAHMVVKWSAAEGSALVQPVCACYLQLMGAVPVMADGMSLESAVLGTLVEVLMYPAGGPQLSSPLADCSGMLVFECHPAAGCQPVH